MPQSDYELMERFRQGDHLAFRAVFERFYLDLCLFSSSIIKNREKGEEIVSETMTKLFQRHDQFESIENVKGFVFITARNSCLNFLASKEYRRLQQNENIDKIAEQGEDEVQDKIVEQEVLKIIEREVESLPEQQKIVFKLFYFEDLTVGEISKKMNIAPTTVRSLKFIAVQKLRVLFSKSGLITMAYASGTLLLN